MRSRLPLVLSLLAVVLMLPAAASAQQELEVVGIDWATDAGIVTFHALFHNYGTQTSEAAGGGIYSQEYGAFMPDVGLIGTFDVPPIPPDSFFDVYVEIPEDQLPPSAQETLPWNKAEKAGDPAAKQACIPDTHWDGNIDIVWQFGGVAGGQIMGHYGTLQVCPSYGSSCIHVVTGCAGTITWTITGVCPGWSAALFNEDMTPAPNPLPPGWSGHVCVSADGTVAVGATCNIALNLTCGLSTVPVNLAATACDCAPVSEETSTWGVIKGLYR